MEYPGYEVDDFYQLNKNHMYTKQWYKSWTVWFNIALLAIDVINQLAKIVPLPPGFLVLVGGFGNVLLRLKTTTGIR